jgi:replicative DNA helicase
MTNSPYEPALRLFSSWIESIRGAERPTFYAVGTGGLAEIEIGPGRLTLLGGPPGQGKTALTMQWVVDALTSSTSLKALVCNVEMDAVALFERQLARLTGIDLGTIRRREYSEQDSERLEGGIQSLRAVVERLAFMRFPCSMSEIAASAADFKANLILVDYIQRIGTHGKHGDPRGAVDAAMGDLRALANSGRSVIVVAALARSKDTKGRSSYREGLSLASFRESSELEYSADDAFILAPTGGTENERDPSALVRLQHLKSRYGEMKDIDLMFDKKYQRFTAIEPNESASESAMQESCDDLEELSKSIRRPTQRKGRS